MTGHHGCSPQPTDSQLLVPRMACVHELFALRARALPHTVAAVSAATGRQLTFAELDGLANRLANRLLAMGVEPESRVGVCVEPGLQLAVAMLGVMKAGAAYVPLDHSYPAARLSHLLRASDATVVLAQPSTIDAVPDCDADVIVLDEEFTEIADAPAASPGVPVTVDGVACVIYTSGSTGVPKGVSITHRGLANLATAAAREFGLGVGDRFLQLASVSFSAVLEEIFPALLSGATLVLAGYRHALPTVDHFLGVLAAHEVTGFEITTAYWHQLVDELTETNRRLPESVRFVVMGGDRVRPDRVLAWQEFGLPLIHVYGPTESTATATYHNTARAVPQADGMLPIGTAIDNAVVRLLDGDFRPVGPGEVGEVFVGGAALARGYHRAPGETAARFVPDPGGRPGSRLYRTGDLARVLPDGELEFLGRSDGQIKIRGFRVEPGEIEAVLQQHPGVRQALVTLRNSDGGSEEAFLAAHVVPHQAGDAAQPETWTEQLRSYLAGLLPGYMVPAVFVVLDAIPLTSHGKVDFDALPPVERGGRPAAAETTPRPGTQAELAEIWQQVLKIDGIGADDEFLRLGGNSLQAVKIVARLRRTFGVEILPSDLLNSPTIAQLAALVDSKRPADGPAVDDEHSTSVWTRKRAVVEASLAPHAGGRRAVPIALSQQGLWMVSKLTRHLPVYNEAWQCRLTGSLDRSAFERAVTEITRRHESLRTAFGTLGGEPVQFVSPDAAVGIRFIDLSDRPAEFDPLRDETIRLPIDPAEPPLLRILVIALSATEHVAVFVAHHLVIDGVSLEVFMDELAVCYDAFHAGDVPQLSALPLQYGDFALWQRNHLRGEHLDRVVGYWRSRLAESEPEPLALPTDRPVPRTAGLDGGRVVIDLSAAVRDDVRALAQRENVTPFMVLLAAFYTLLHRITGSTDLCVGTPVANRAGPGVDRLIGYISNTVVLRTRVPDDSSFRDLLASVRATCIEAYEHQSLPFDQLVEKLRPRRHAGHSPLFQVLFALEDEKVLDRTVSGLTFADFDILWTGCAKFELACMVVDHSDHMEVSFTYRADLFDESTVSAIAADYQRLLVECVADPGHAATAALVTAS